MSTAPRRAMHPDPPARCRFRKYFALALPGGLITLWMWPLELSTNSCLPAQHLRRRIACLPRRDVVCGARRR